jgi:hypothetical protein
MRKTSPISATVNGVLNETLKSRNRIKSKIRARVETAFSVLKRLWGFSQCATAIQSGAPALHVFRAVVCPSLGLQDLLFAEAGALVRKWVVLAFSPVVFPAPIPI